MLESLTSQTGQILVTAMALIAVMNPFGNLPVFLEMTDDLGAKTRQKLFRIITLTALIIVIIFLIIGPFIMEHLFRIHIADLRIAGGLTLIVMGIYNLLFPHKEAPTTTNENEDEDELIKHSILPMAFPMLVGPGTLSTVIVFSSDLGLLLTFIATLIAFSTIRFLFFVGPAIEKLTGHLVLFVMARIMKVFIIAIGVSMIISGVSEVFDITLTY